MTEAREFASSERSYVIAPAGCGKTQLIAKAIAVSTAGDRPQLVLTHTHAGVDALRRRLRSLGVSRTAAHVDTIAGWSLQYASAFPSLSGITSFVPNANEEWNAVYDAAQRVLRYSAVAKVIHCSYADVYVDEYQDCTVQQHRLICSLAEILNCRIVGDPLQGIFDFGSNRIVDWEKDIRHVFFGLPQLTKPWRWNNTNPALGAWLSQVRDNIRDGQPIDLRRSPVEWHRLTQEQDVRAWAEAAFEKARTNESVVLIHKWQPQCHNVSSRLRGIYSCIEPIECADLFDACKRFQDSIGVARALAVLEFACTCMTGIRTQMRSTLKAFNADRFPERARKNLGQLGTLRKVIETDELSVIAPAIARLQQVPGARVHRRELLRELKRTLKEFGEGEYENLEDAAWTVRNLTRRLGRKLPRCTVGRTLLIKGLEFDHAIILDADQLDAKNLYVAMTRGSRSLTVFSRRPVLYPKKG